ncbi:hypothetical protein ABBQ32_012299 [Trebouxia sp. C0010 RCD-2024]
MVSLVNQIAGRAVASPRPNCQAKAAIRVSRLYTVLVKSHSIQQQERTQATEFTAAAPKTQAPAPAPRPVEERQQGSAPSVRINVIAKSRWANGIPPVMGAHLMASGEPAPISTSKGADLGGIPHAFHYADKEINADVVQFTNADVGAQGIARLVQQAAEDAIKQKGSFTLVLSGGSLLKGLTPLASIKGLDWSKWHIFYVDERNVAHSHPDSTHKGAQEAFLSKVDIPAENVHAIKEGLSVKDAATEYAGQILHLSENVIPKTSNSPHLPVFDLILLGIGPDGHVASLFPNRDHTTGASEGIVLPVDNSPKPPPERISFSMPVINAAKQVVVVAFGGGKAEIVQRALEVQALPGALPAQLVKPASGSLTWYLDADSAQGLHIQHWEDKKAFPRSS